MTRNVIRLLARYMYLNLLTKLKNLNLMARLMK